MSNPWLSVSFPVQWDSLTAETLPAAVEELMTTSVRTVQAIATTPVDAATFATVIVPLDRVWTSLLNLFNIANFFSIFLLDRKDIIDASAEVSARITAFKLELYTNADVFARVCHVRETARLDETERRLVDRVHADFVDGGALLSPSDQAQLKRLQAAIQTNTDTFLRNITADIDQYELVVDEARLAGTPERAVAAMRAAAEQAGRDGCLVTLRAPSYGPVMTYCTDAALRKELYERNEAVCTSGATDNTQLVLDMLSDRAAAARLLGWKTHADRVASRRMAQTGARAMRFIDDLADRVRPAFERDMARLCALKAETSAEPLMPWDVAFYSAQLRQRELAYSPEETRPYLPLDAVMAGLFDVYRRLYNATFTREDVPVWHPDVLCYSVATPARRLGVCYFDLFARKGKQGGGMQDYIALRDATTGPICFVLANFPPPHNGACLLSAGEVDTLFHESGHLMHSLLNAVPYGLLYSFNVPWDFVETPSQIMERWVVQPETLDFFVAHGARRMPEELVRKVRAVERFLPGVFWMRQMGLAKMDMELHTSFDAAAEPLDDFIRRVTRPFSYDFGVPVRSIIRQFKHIFHGAYYDAGYYSYSWSEVIAADAFALFKEKGIFNPDVARAFMGILEAAASRDVMQLFVQFRGREPQPGFLLKEVGLE